MNPDGYPFWEMRSSCSNLDEVMDYFMDNYLLFFENGLKYTIRDVKHIIYPKSYSIEFLGKPTMVDCYHNAPFGKPTNWGGRKKDLPTSYNGFRSRVIFNFGSEYNLGWEVFKYTGLWTTTCSGLRDSYICHFDMFYDDWPLMKALWEAENL